MKSSRANSHMGGGKSKSKKSGSKPHSIHIRRGHKGGFIVEHHHRPAGPGEMAEEMQEHPVANMDDLQAHLQQNMGDQPPMQPATPPAAAGAAGGAPPAGM